MGALNMAQTTKSEEAVEGYAKCPKCGKPAMPRRKPDSRAIGRRCQECGYIEEFKTEEPKCD
jgi:predicted RNA-binding Zn-ribbon protein involved in translation (DUF1610 family)